MTQLVITSNSNGSEILNFFRQKADTYIAQDVVDGIINEKYGANNAFGVKIALSAFFKKNCDSMATISKNSKLCYSFTEQLVRLLTAGTKIDSRYLYVALYGLQGNNPSVQLGLQYQQEIDILHDAGYMFGQPVLVPAGQEDKVRSVFNENGEETLKYEGHRCTLSSESTLGKSDEYGKTLKQIAYAFINYQFYDAHGLLHVGKYEIPLDALECSVNRTKQQNDNAVKKGKSKTAKVMFSGLFRIVESACYHRLYNYLILRDNDIEEYEIGQSFEKEQPKKESIAEINKRKALDALQKEKEQKEQKIKEAEQVDSQADATEQQQSEQAEAVADKPVEESWLSKHCKHIDAHANDEPYLYKLLEKYEALPAKSERYSEDDRKKAIDKVQALIKAKQTGTAKQAIAKEKEGMF